MEIKTIYSDEFIDIFDDYLILKKYYFLRFGNKKIKFSEIEKIQEVRLVYFNGLTRHEQVWLTPRFPFDWRVKDRKEGILITLKNKFWKIGISASNLKDVSIILYKKLN